MRRRSFGLLVKLSEDKTHKAAIAMGQALQALELSKRKLIQVRNFYHEYQGQRLARSLQGITANQLLDYQKFLDKLTTAIEFQERDILKKEEIYLNCVQDWKQERQRLKAFEVINQKQLKRIELKERRDEQKMFDELATSLLTRSYRDFDLE